MERDRVKYEFILTNKHSLVHYYSPFCFGCYYDCSFSSISFHHNLQESKIASSCWIFETVSSDRDYICCSYCFCLAGNSYKEWHDLEKWVYNIIKGYSVVSATVGVPSTWDQNLNNIHILLDVGIFNYKFFFLSFIGK